MASPELMVRVQSLHFPYSTYPQCARKCAYCRQKYRLNQVKSILLMVKTQFLSLNHVKPTFLMAKSLFPYGYTYIFVTFHLGCQSLEHTVLVVQAQLPRVPFSASLETSLGVLKMGFKPPGSNPPKIQMGYIDTYVYICTYIYIYSNQLCSFVFYL